MSYSGYGALKPQTATKNLFEKALERFTKELAPHAVQLTGLSETKVKMLPEEMNSQKAIFTAIVKDLMAFETPLTVPCTKEGYALKKGIDLSKSYKRKPYTLEVKRWQIDAGGALGCTLIAPEGGQLVRYYERSKKLSPSDKKYFTNRIASGMMPKEVTCAGRLWKKGSNQLWVADKAPSSDWLDKNGKATAAKFQLATANVIEIKGVEWPLVIAEKLSTSKK